MAYKTIQEVQINDTIWYIEKDGRIKNKLYTATVTKITTKSIYISTNPGYTKEICVNKKTLKDYDSKYGYNIQVYTDANEYYDEQEYEKIKENIIDFFRKDTTKLPLGEMRKFQKEIEKVSENK